MRCTEAYFCQSFVSNRRMTRVQFKSIPFIDQRPKFGHDSIVFVYNSPTKCPFHKNSTVLECLRQDAFKSVESRYWINFVRFFSCALPIWLPLCKIQTKCVQYLDSTDLNASCREQSKTVAFLWIGYFLCAGHVFCHYRHLHKGFGLVKPREFLSELASWGRAIQTSL